MVDVRTNLLKHPKTLSEKDYQRERKILQNAVLMSIVVVVVLLALSIWNLILSQRLSQIETQIMSNSQKLQGLTKASATQIYLKSRLSLIKVFLKDRGMTREALQKVLSINIEGTHINNLAFVDERTLSVAYLTHDQLSMNNLLKYFETETDYFVQTVSKSLNRNPDGEYQVSLLLTMPKGEK